DQEEPHPVDQAPTPHDKDGHLPNLSRAPSPALATAVRTTLTPFANDPNATTLNDLSQALNQLSTYTNSRYEATPGPWADSRAACDHAHEHIQHMNRTFTRGTSPTALEVRTVKYATLAASTLFTEAVLSDTLSPADGHHPNITGPNVSGSPRAAAHLLGNGWQAQPGLHNTEGHIRHPDGETYLPTAGDTGDTNPQLYPENHGTRHVLGSTHGEEPNPLAACVADTTGDLPKHHATDTSAPEDPEHDDEWTDEYWVVRADGTHWPVSLDRSGRVRNFLVTHSPEQKPDDDTHTANNAPPHH
uniref:hypothetical protein n=1 Tax=Streptomyces clavuligerus TaxID=1901 RepID=UPI001E60B49F